MTTAIALTIPEAAAAVGVSERFLRDRIREGDLDARYAGTKRIVLRSELEAWAESLPSQRPGREGAR